MLGIHWDPKEDVLRLLIKLNFSGILNGIRTEPDLTINDIPEKIPSLLTKRKVMSQRNGTYNPIHHERKIIIRKLWMLKLDWDDPLPPSIRMECIELFGGILEVSSITLKIGVQNQKPQRVILYSYYFLMLPWKRSVVHGPMV